MALTKANSALLSSQTTTTTSSAHDMSAAYSASLDVSITQTGTASTAANWKLQLSVDGGTTYFDGPTYAAGTAAATYYWAGVPIPSEATHAKVAYTQQSGGTSSSCTAHIGKITGL